MVQEEPVKEEVKEEVKLLKVGDVTVSDTVLDDLKLSGDYKSFTDETSDDSLAIVYGDLNGSREGDRLTFTPETEVYSLLNLLPINNNLKELSQQGIVWVYARVNNVLCIIYKHNKTTHILPIGQHYEAETFAFMSFFIKLTELLENSEQTKDVKEFLSIMYIFLDTYKRIEDMPHVIEDQLLNPDREHRSMYDEEGYRYKTPNTLVLDVNNGGFDEYTFNMQRSVEYNDIFKSKLKRIKHNTNSLANWIGEYLYVDKDGSILVEIFEKDNAPREEALIKLINKTFNGMVIKVPTHESGSGHNIENGAISNFSNDMEMVRRVQNLFEQFAPSWLRFTSPLNTYGSGNSGYMV